MIKNQEIITNILKDENITPSYTRIQIYNYLSQGKIHATVDEIFIDLEKILPSLSKTTVYNTLKLFLEKKIVNPINLYDNKMRYELARSDHAHFHCDTCSKIYDIPINRDINLPDNLKDSVVDEHHLILIGTCPDCLDKN